MPVSIDPGEAERFAELVASPEFESGERGYKVALHEVLSRLLEPDNVRSPGFPGQLGAFFALRSSEGLEEAESLLRDLTRARRRASFLDAVRMPSALSARVTMVLLKRPPYRAMFEGYLELHRSAAVRFEDPTLDAPLENLPSLYQLWGTMRVIQATLEVGAQLGFTVVRHNLVRRDPQGLFVRILPDGRPSLELRHSETGVKLVLTPSAPSGRARRGTCARSRSRRRTASGSTRPSPSGTSRRSRR